MSNNKNNGGLWLIIAVAVTFYLIAVGQLMFIFDGNGDFLRVREIDMVLGGILFMITVCIIGFTWAMYEVIKAKI